MVSPAAAGASDSGGAYWDRVLEEWEPSIAHRLWRAHSDAVNTRLLRRWLPSAGGGSGSGGRLLKTDLFDEAVGRGLYPELAAHAAEVVGVDVSSAVVRAAGERHRELHAGLGDVLALPFPDASFDIVVSNSTLDHFGSRPQLSDAVGELARVLVPGGRLLITLDNLRNPIVAVRTSPLAVALRRLGVVPYFVGVTCGVGGLTTVLGHHDLDVADTTAIMHCPPQLAAHASARIAPKSADSEIECRHLRRVLPFEAMERWPTRHLTGHFVAALAVKC
jgi:SAM-dependent methyltransferase